MEYDIIKNKIIEASKKHPLYNNIIKTNGNIVIGRGSKNPEYLFIGEAPGGNENIQGQPFIGKSGKLLDKWMLENDIKSFSIINSIPIIPLDENNKIRQPTDSEISYFRPFIKELIEFLKPKYIICIGKSAAKCLEKDFKLSEWTENIGFIYHPSYYLRNNIDGSDDFRKLINNKLHENVSDYEEEIVYYDKKQDEVLKDFINKINGKIVDEKTFIFENKKWFIDFHPFDHSDDIIISKDDSPESYDNFLLIKVGSSKIRIAGWTDKKTLLSTPARDIYRNGKEHYCVFDTNIKDLKIFKIKKQKILLKDFMINQQKAENIGGTEMISGILAGLHSFVKQSGQYFKDINQKDECCIGDKKAKIYTRDAMMDEDMLVYDEYFNKHPEIDYYILCKIKGGNYNYIGYVTKEIINNTRIVQMVGQDNDAASKNIRMIFAEQYKPLSDMIKILIDDKKEEIKDIEEQDYVPLHQHSEFSIGDGFGKINYICDALKNKGFKGAALTDHGTLAGAWEFQKAMLERNMKPIIGCEIYTKLEGIEQRFHSTVLVKNEIGWKNLLRLHSFAVRENFYYKPIIPFEMLLENSEGLILMSGCMSAILPNFVKNNKIDMAEELLIKILDKFKDDFYIEIMLHDIEGNQEIMKKLYELSLKFGIKCIITPDSHYPYKEDIKYHEAVKAISLRKKYGEAGFSDKIFYLLQKNDIDELINKNALWMKDFYKTFLKNTFDIMDKIDFKITPPKENDTLPRYKAEFNMNDDKKRMYLEKVFKYKRDD